MCAVHRLIQTGHHNKHLVIVYEDMEQGPLSTRALICLAEGKPIPEYLPEPIQFKMPAKPRRLTCIEMLNALDGRTQQSSSVVDLDGKQPSYDGYASTEHDRTYYKRGRNDRYKDRRQTAKGSRITRVTTPIHSV